ncbi:MAG: hypothetical protein P8X74_01980 [Reinekea sp.]
MLPKNQGEPMGAPAIFEKQIEIKLLPPAPSLKSRIQVIFMGIRTTSYFRIYLSPKLEGLKRGNLCS